MSSEERCIGSSESSAYFFDTYALVEIYESSPRYSAFIEVAFFTTMLNLFEFHQYLLRVVGEKDADKDVAQLLPHVINFSLEVVKKASKFRKQHSSKNLSMTDCIGYIFAKENGLVFLTGDSAFAGMENVEFVK